MKKILSVLFAVLLLLTSAIPAFGADLYTNTSDTPIVYFLGKVGTIVNGEGKVIHPIEDMPDDYIMNAVKECLPYLFDAMAGGDWATYREKVLSFVEPLYTELRLDGNGDPQFGSNIGNSKTSNRSFRWDSATVTKNIKAKKGKYKMNSCEYCMDWRLDPYEIADDFHAFVQTVKAAAGVDKIDAVFRCEACSVLGAYFEKYGYEDFNCIELYVSCLGGIDLIGAFFGGNLKFDAASLTRFLDSYEENLQNGIGNDAITEFIYDTLYLLKDTYALDAIAMMLQPVASKLYKEVIAPCVLASYGTFPGIWSLVPAEDYANAKKNIFKGVEDEYAGLIAKLDYYQDHVNTKYIDLIKGAKDAGVKTAVYAKYGEFTAIPISKANNEVTDGIVTLTRSSFGATTPAYDKLLDAKYLANAEANGTAKYISPDKKVDASTALFPDTTWIICNNYHDVFSDQLSDRLMMRFFMADGELTVFDDPEIPQYLSCEGYTDFTVLTEDDGFKTELRDTTVNGTKKSVKQQVIDFVNSLLRMLAKLLSMFLNGELF